DRGGAADRERLVRRLGAGEVVDERGRPRAERDVGQRGMERIAEPDAVEDVADRLRDGVDRLLHRVGDGVERLRETRELLREPEVRHAVLVPGAAGTKTLGAEAERTAEQREAGEA